MDDPPAAIAKCRTFCSDSMQLAQFGLCECIGPAPRPDMRAEQRFIGIDIPHTVQQLLIEQRRLDRRFAGVKQSRKLFCVDTQRLRRPAR